MIQVNGFFNQMQPINIKIVPAKILGEYSMIVMEYTPTTYAVSLSR